MGRSDDFLEAAGMSKQDQHIASVNAANVPVNEFEGEVAPIGTYSSKSANLLRNITQHRAREVKVKKEYEK